MSLGGVRLAATPRRPVDNAEPKLATVVYNFDRIEALAAEVYRRIDTLVATGPFTLQSLDDPQLVEKLTTLSTHLFGMRFARAQLTLGELIGKLIEGAEGRPLLVSVDPVLGQVPWELMRLPEGPDEPLGNRVHVCGSLEEPAGSDAVSEGLLAVSVVGGGRADHEFDSVVELRAAGDTALVGGVDEAGYLAAPGGVTTGKVAPIISHAEEEAPFFGHFGPEGYDIVHFFAHCLYNADGFQIGVSDGYALGVLTFKIHKAAFRPRAFHFLNVCRGAPSPANRTRSLVEYVKGEHDAGAVLTTLATVRSASAWEMARAFYAAFLPPAADAPGRPAVEALAVARQALLANGNAEGYLYRMYGRPDARLTPLDWRDKIEAA